MARSSIYKSASGKRRIQGVYDELVRDLEGRFERRFIDTRYGETHTLLTGSEENPPLFIFHGGNLPNPVSLEWFLPLADTFHLHAPDTVGHPGYSAQTRLSTHDGSYGRWVVDLLDELGFDQVPMVGPSYGGGIILHTAVAAPERITKAGLIVPSALGRGSFPRMLWSIILPMVVYRITSNQGWLLRSIDPIFSEPLTEIDERIIQLIALSYDELKLETEFPKTVTPDDLAAFSAPTLLAVAEEDIFFPPDVIVPNAKWSIRNLETIVRLNGESHFPSTNARARLIAQLRTFLSE